MEDQSRMMLYPQQQNYGGLSALGEEQGATSPAPAQGGEEGARTHQDINSILDQIMNITDQSLDEAQVPFVTTL